jgi:phosphate transport system substrate-binding protein
VRSISRRLVWLLAVLVALTLVAAACGDDDDDGGTAAGSEDLSGTIDVSGSSTVEPITTRVSENWEDSAPDVVVNVDGPGTGDGFALFCEGETDISDASRPIKDDEAATCEKNNISYVELKVGIDGLTVMTSPDTSDVECLNFNDLYALMGPESQGVDNWKDAEPLAKELGSTTTLPDTDLVITAPGKESGTYDSFVELALQGIAEGRAEAGKIEEDDIETTRLDYSSQADDNRIVDGIEGSEGSFGWVGFAFAEEAGSGVEEIEIDGGDGCVEPSSDTLKDGSYPLSRFLYVYVNKEKLDASPALKAFVDYYLSDDGITAVEEVGYVALADADLQKTRDVWEKQETGTHAEEG